MVDSFCSVGIKLDFFSEDFCCNIWIVAKHSSNAPIYAHYTNTHCPKVSSNSYLESFDFLAVGEKTTFFRLVIFLSDRTRKYSLCSLPLPFICGLPWNSQSQVRQQRHLLFIVRQTRDDRPD